MVRGFIITISESFSVSKFGRLNWMGANGNTVLSEKCREIFIRGSSLIGWLHVFGFCRKKGICIMWTEWIFKIIRWSQQRKHPRNLWTTKNSLLVRKYLVVPADVSSGYGTVSVRYRYSSMPVRYRYSNSSPQTISSPSPVRRFIETFLHPSRQKRVWE